MTVQKALNEINFLIITHKNIIQVLNYLTKKWKQQNPNSHISTEVGDTLIAFSEENVRVLERIKKQLEPKKYRHLKKM